MKHVLDSTVIVDDIPRSKAEDIIEWLASSANGRRILQNAMNRYTTPEQLAMERTREMYREWNDND